MPIRHLLMLIVLSAVALFWRLGVPALHHAEGDWAAIVFNMFDHGRVFILQIGQFDYYDKPFLSYWLMLVCAKVVGRVSEGALRFPSALAGLASVLITYAFARRLFGPRVALHSALILLSTSGFVLWGRIAQSEMLNLLGILAPLWLFFCWRESASNAWLYTMGIVMAIGSWTKGPLCFAVPGLIIVLYSVFFRDWKWFRGIHVIAAGALALGLYFSVFVLGWLDTGRWDALSLVYRENVVRLFSPWDHVRPFYYYFYAVPAILAPWSLILPWIVVYLIKTRRSWNQELKLVLLVLAGIWAFFALSGSRRSYYLIPMLPFTAMLVAVWLEALVGMTEKWKRSFRSFWLAGGILALVPLIVRLSIPRSLISRYIEMLASGPMAVDRVASVVWSVPVTLACVALALVGVSWLYLGANQLRPRSIRIFVAGVCTGVIIYFGLLVPEFDKLRGYREFVKEIAALAPPGQTIGIYPKHKAAIVFYLQAYQGMKSYGFFTNLAEARETLLKTRGILIAEERDPLPPESWERLLGENKLRVKVRTDSEQYAWGVYRPRPTPRTPPI